VYSRMITRYTQALHSRNAVGQTRGEQALLRKDDDRLAISPSSHLHILLFIFFDLISADEKSIDHFSINYKSGVQRVTNRQLGKTPEMAKSLGSGSTIRRTARLIPVGRGSAIS